MNYLYIISGPGGCGKDAIIEALLKDNDLRLQKLVNYTSRPMRVGEINGEGYFFVSKADFEKEIAAGNILEYEIMESNGEYYGTHKPTLISILKKGSVISKKMPFGALNIKKKLPNQTVTIFIDADDQELLKRLNEPSRIGEKRNVEKRFEQAIKERKYKTQFDYTFWNHDGKLNKTVDEISTIIAQREIQH